MSALGARVGRWVELEPVTPALEGELHQVYVQGDIASRWRTGGLVLPAEGFVDATSQGAVLDNALRARDGEVFGRVTVTQRSSWSTHAHVSAYVHPDARRRPAVIEGIAMGCAQAFDVLPIQKLYLEVVEYNVEQFGSALRYFEREGSLREHVYLDGRYWDQHVYALTRERFENGVQ